jgi:hypothetical protein
MDVRAELYHIIHSAQSALAALDDEHEGNFRRHLATMERKAVAVVEEVHSW